MRAAVMRDGRIVVDEVPEPAPGPGELLVRTLACGICGSDLHMLTHGRRWAERSGEAGAPIVWFDAARDVVMGHEFAAEVLETGAGVEGFGAGDRVVALPMIPRGEAIEVVGYSNEYPGGYGERMVVNSLLTLPVPNGLSTRVAALTEPLSVARHAVNKAGLRRGEGAVVLGCGPIGLATIAVLRADGHEDIVAADFSPMRRALAEQLGATVVVDPAQDPAIAAWRRRAAPATPLVIFECVGVPGVIGGALQAAPPNARLVVIGVCMESDHIDPLFALLKEISVQFVFGYQPEEFADTLRALAEGELRVEAMITGTATIDGVAEAFAALGSPDEHAKIVVEH
jgi:threonine dehydrogenase-like Zn-dependent dehydrogenase